jgi:DNA invertase Pin-like site-specific DNA recombinase
VRAFATFEREMMLERQADGIAKAKMKGVYTGRKPTAKAKSAEVIDLLAQGKTKAAVAAEHISADLLGTHKEVGLKRGDKRPVDKMPKVIIAAPRGAVLPIERLAGGW